MQVLESEKSALTMDEKALGDKVGSLEAALMILRDEKASLEKEVESEREVCTLLARLSHGRLKCL